jgi:hypothetical protein
MRLRFGRPKRELAAAGAWAIGRCGGLTPWCLVPLTSDNRPDIVGPGRGVYYCRTLEAARQALPPGLLCVTGLEAAALVRSMPRRFTPVIEVWF